MGIRSKERYATNLDSSWTILNADDAIALFSGIVENIYIYGLGTRLHPGSPRGWIDRKNMGLTGKHWLLPIEKRNNN